MKTFITVLLLVGLPAIVLAKDLDPRLATIRQAWVEAVDELGDDQPIAACFAEHLTRTTPLTPAASKDQAEVILRISAHLPGNTLRQMTGLLGTVKIEARLADGTLLWDARENISASKSLASYAALDIPCSLADGAADKLRQAMRKARDK